MASIVSERYALSLYELAKEGHKAQALLDELTAVRQVFAENPDLMKVLRTPSIGLAAKTDLLRQVFGGRVDVLLLHFLMLITEKRRISMLNDMAEAYKQQLYLEEGICEVHAVTAAPLSAELTQKLQNKMCAVTGKQVVLQVRVDPSILGGVIINIGHTQIDTSVKTKLYELARKLTETIA